MTHDVPVHRPKRRKNVRRIGIVGPPDIFHLSPQPRRDGVRVVSHGPARVQDGQFITDAILAGYWVVDQFRPRGRLDFALPRDADPPVAAGWYWGVRDGRKLRVTGFRYFSYLYNVKRTQTFCAACTRDGVNSMMLGVTRTFAGARSTAPHSDCTYRLSSARATCAVAVAGTSAIKPSAAPALHSRVVRVALIISSQAGICVVESHTGTRRCRTCGTVADPLLGVCSEWHTCSR